MHPLMTQTMKLLWWLTDRGSISTSFALFASSSSRTAPSVYRTTSQLMFTMFTVSTLLQPAQCQQPAVTACGQEELTNCAKPLSVLSSTSELSIYASKEDLDNLCPDLNVGLQCIRSYTRRCMNINQREHFNKLYQGTSEMVRDLCEDENYKEDFLRHAPCIRVVKKNFVSCELRYQETMTKIVDRGQQQYPPTTTTTTTTVAPWLVATNFSFERKTDPRRELSEEEDHVRMICCAFQEYKECSEETVHNTCGHETAKFTKKFLDKMSSQLIKMHCKDYGAGSAMCSPSTSSSIQLEISLILHLLAATCVSIWHL